MTTDTLTITDNRTGTSYEVPIHYGTYPDYGAAINALELRQIKASEDDFGLLTYDPGFTNTASCRSSITFVDGEKGILRYRGYPIEQLAAESNYLETAYLILHGELPDSTQLHEWACDITHHTIIHENIKKFMDGFHHDAHPMGMLISTLGAMSTFYPEARMLWRWHADVPANCVGRPRQRRGYRGHGVRALLWRLLLRKRNADSQDSRAGNQQCGDCGACGTTTVIACFRWR